MTRLQKGMIVMLGRKKYRIDFVNDCRARAIPLQKTRVNYTTLEGIEVDYMANLPAINISPNAGCPIISD